jgi:hypothetical protein
MATKTTASKTAATPTRATTTKSVQSKPAERRKASPATSTKADIPKATAKPTSAPTIRIARHLLDPIVKTEGRSALGKRLAAAETLQDGSKRITYAPADLDALQAHARAVDEAEDTDRGTRRSARALVTWIDGLRAKATAK